MRDFLRYDLLRNSNAISGRPGAKTCLLLQYRLDTANDILVTTGGHTHSHVNLSSLPECRHMAEILKNKEILEKALGCTVDYLSHPFGSDGGLTAETKGILRDVGFRPACGNSYGTAGIAGKINRHDLPGVKAGNPNTFAFYRFPRRLFD